MLFRVLRLCNMEWSGKMFLNDNVRIWKETPVIHMKILCQISIEQTAKSRKSQFRKTCDPVKTQTWDCESKSRELPALSRLMARNGSVQKKMTGEGAHVCNTTVSIKVKLKVKFSLCFNWTPRREGVLDTRWRWVVSFTPQPLYSQGKSICYPLDRRLGGPQSHSGRGGKEKNSQTPPGTET
jgi:hypothetical protein